MMSYRQMKIASFFVMGGCVYSGWVSSTPDGETSEQLKKLL